MSCEIIQVYPQNTSAIIIPNNNSNIIDVSTNNSTCPDASSFATIDNLYLTGHNLYVLISNISGGGSTGNINLGNYHVVYLTGDNNQTSNFTNRTLLDAGNVQSLDWNNRILKDDFQNYSIQYKDRFLRNSAQDYVLDWNNRILSGNWWAESIKISGGNLITSNDTGQFYTQNNPSGFINHLDNVVYTSGDQTINGIKTFNIINIGDLGINNILNSIYNGNNNLYFDLENGVLGQIGTLNPICVYFANRVLSGLWTIDDLRISGHPLITNANSLVTGLSIAGSNVILTGSVIISAGVDIQVGQSANGITILSPNVQQTGISLQSSINLNSGHLTTTGQSLYVYITSLSGAEDTKINNIILNSGYITSGQTGQFYFATNPQNYSTSGNVQNTGSNLQISLNLDSGHLISTGQSLYNYLVALSGSEDTKISNINNLTGSFYPYNNPSNFSNSGNLQNLSGYFENQLSINNTVRTTGTQLINGTKAFLQEASFSNGAIMGLLVVASTNNGTLATIVNGGNGAFIDMNAQALIDDALTTGLNWKNRNLSGNWNAQLITMSGNPLITGINTGSFASINNLQTTGINLQNSINLISGNLITSGQNLNNKINLLSGYINNSNVSNIVYITGDQNINGNKNFIDGLQVQNNFGVDGIYRYNIDNAVISILGSALVDDLTNDSLRWNTRELLSNDSPNGDIVNTVLNWYSGYLFDSGNIPSIDWFNRNLSGNWNLNNNPIINSGNLDSYSTERIYKTQKINFKITGNYNILTVPNNYLFMIDTMEVLTTDTNNASSAPYIKFGNTNDLQAYKTPIQTTSNSTYSRHIFDSPQDAVPAGTIITASISTGSTAINHSGFLLFKGTLIPNA